MTGFESLEPDWLAPREAAAEILRGFAPLQPETVDLDAADGRVLAEDIPARATLPPWRSSSMDGYACRGADVEGATADDPVDLRLAGEVRAGEAPEVRVEAGEAVKVMTGAPVPRGADSVVRVEDTDAGEGAEGRVVVRSDRDAGANVRRAGSDVEAGEIVLRRGAPLTPGRIGVLAAAGYGTVPVHRSPRVALLSNGDELVEVARFEEAVAGRGVVDANRASLGAAVRAAGGRPEPLGIARDTRESIRDRLADARDADLLVTTGGASMGDRDLLKRTLREMGFELAFWRARIRPGSPLSFGHLPRARGRPPLPVLGLPGNPVSAYVTFELFGRPVVRRLAGHRLVHRRAVEARAGEALETTDGLTHFLRVVLDEDAPGGVPEARLTGSQGSHVLSGVGRADGLAVVPEGTVTVEAGDPVRVIPLEPGFRHGVAPAF